MPTPKPGQILCPTCHRATPPAAFCTQCGAAIPATAHARPRGMDRDELEERIRTRRPGEVTLRRGTQLEDDERPARASGYMPFVPEPEDAMAVREEEAAPPAANVDHTSADFDEQPGAAAEPPPVELPADRPQTVYAQPEREYVSAGELPEEEPYNEPYDDEPYGAPEDAYPQQATYAAPAGSGSGRRGGGALPIIGFILLCVLALGVGAALAGVLGGGGIGQGSASPSSEGSASPEPTDGPITFADGAILTVQPCATQDMSFDGCGVDGSVISESTMWVWIGFEKTGADDVVTLTLRSEGQTIDQQEKVLGDVLTDCQSNGEPICSGYLIGAAYRDLQAGDYELIVRRNDDFADSATFTVES
jgi:hypothetical protein